MRHSLFTLAARSLEALVSLSRDPIAASLLLGGGILLVAETEAWAAPSAEGISFRGEVSALRTTPTLRASGSASSVWGSAEVDTTGSVGSFISTGISLDANGSPVRHVAYYDATSNNGDLKYARRDPITGWSTETVRSTANDEGNLTSMVVDSSGTVNIFHYDQTTSKWWHSFGTSGSWTHEEVYDLGSPGIFGYSSAAAAHPDGFFLAFPSPADSTLRMAVKDAGVWNTYSGSTANDYRDFSMVVDTADVANLSYVDPVGAKLRLARFNTSGAQLLDLVIDDISCNGCGTSTVLDSQDRINILYMWNDSGQARLRRLRLVSPFFSDLSETVADGIHNNLSLAVDDQDDFYATARDNAADELIYADNTSGSWATEVVAPMTSFFIGNYASVLLHDSEPGIVWYEDGEVDLEFATQRKFEDAAAGLPPLNGAAAAWGDYDGDGDPDLALTGTSSGNRIAQIWRQDPGGFVDIAAGLPDMWGGDAAWGDHDGDGDLDLLISGRLASDFTRHTYVYENDGGSFVQILDVADLESQTLAWGDYDNDGDLDFAMAGYDRGPNVRVSRIYRNDSGSFVDAGAGLIGLNTSSVAWGDHDNDGDLDLAISGYNGTAGTGTSRIYVNDGGTFTFFNLPNSLLYASLAWADYDNDGDLDLAHSGTTNFSTSGARSRIYRNDGGSFVQVEILLGAFDGTLAWGDYDNDGDPDLAVSGRDPSDTRFAKIYENVGGDVFAEEVAANFTDVAAGGRNLAWGDFDDDGLLDLLLAGRESDGVTDSTRIYRNLGDTVNTPPTAPTNLAAAVDPTGVTFSWSPATDAETPSNGLSYNLRVGTSPGANDLLASMADASSGDRRIPALGNTTTSLSWRVETTAAPLYWSVQAIDAGYEGGPFAQERVDRLFVNLGAGLPGVEFSSVAWGDQDNDGDLDILLTGLDAGFNPIARVYRNDGAGSFADVGAGLPGVYDASVAWGDQDNDGDLDILLMGTDAGDFQITRVYRNDGSGSFADLGAGLPGVEFSSVAWGDQDNDGDLDILLTGLDAGFNPIARVYRNDGSGSFSDVGAGLPGVYLGSVAWGDQDNDGDLDILLTGVDAGGNRIARVYRNDGSGSFADLGAGLPGVYRGSVAWGDQDNDGDLDILLTGLSSFLPIARVYRNDGSGSFSDVGAGLPGVYLGSVAWGDQDNDGDLDILLTGEDAGGNLIARVYRNDGSGSFSDVGAGLPGVRNGSVAWGDQDNDGDLDILLTGRDAGGNPIARVYENFSSTANTNPAPPGGLSSSWSAEGLTLSWNPASDPETPASGLSYNVRVGTTPGGSDISAAMADSASGYRRIPALGNANQNLSWTLDIPPGTYYWGVQAIDAAWAGSPFATATTDFADLGAGLPGVGSGSVAWGDQDNDGDLDILLTGQDAANNFIARVYRNDGSGSFADLGAGLPGVYEGSVAWGDQDNDGDLDILLTGRDAGLNRIARVYRNDGSGSFADLGAGLPGVWLSSVAWGDQDNDGDLDILLTGRDAGSNPIARVYRNDGSGSFADLGAGLPGVYRGSVAWGDQDNDGDLDILLTGLPSFLPIARVYRNDGSGSFADLGAGLPGVYQGSVAWGDQDNDGDLDILLTGRDTSFLPIARVYRNDGSGSFADLGAGLPGVRDASVAWGDQDNDGDLDILLTGQDAGNNPIACLYRNDGSGSFADLGAGFPGVVFSSVAWGDQDNDGDLDILLTGRDAGLNPIARVYENLASTANTNPAPPGGLSSSWSAEGLTLSWNPASDPETPASGLSYNVRVGTTPGGDEISAAMADSASGYRRIPALGNANQNLSWTLDLPPGTYYWGVQSIDAAWAGSPFATATTDDPTTVAGEGGAPAVFAIQGNRPNPFNPTTMIRYQVPNEAPVNISVYDISGRRVRTLVDVASHPVGRFEAIYDGRDDSGKITASGVYFYRMESGEFRSVHKMVLVR